MLKKKKIAAAVPPHKNDVFRFLRRSRILRYGLSDDIMSKEQKTKVRRGVLGVLNTGGPTNRFCAL